MALSEPAHSSWSEAEPLSWCPDRELELLTAGADPWDLELAAGHELVCAEMQGWGQMEAWSWKLRA